MGYVDRLWSSALLRAQKQIAALERKEDALMTDLRCLELKCDGEQVDKMNVCKGELFPLFLPTCYNYTRILSLSDREAERPQADTTGGQEA